MSECPRIERAKKYLCRFFKGNKCVCASELACPLDDSNQAIKVGNLEVSLRDAERLGYEMEMHYRRLRLMYGCRMREEIIVINPDRCAEESTCEYANSSKCQVWEHRQNMERAAKRVKVVKRLFRHCGLHNDIRLDADGFCHSFLSNDCGDADNKYCPVQEQYRDYLWRTGEVEE